MKLQQPMYIEKRKNSSHIDLNGVWDYAYLDQITENLSEIQYSFHTQIPNSAYWSLYESGILPHPYEGSNCTLYRFVDEKVWYYRKKFKVNQNQKVGDAFLCFDGVAYYCRVWLNGELLGEHEGMFGGPIVNVADRLQYGAENELVVEVKAVNYGIKETFDEWNRKGNNTQIVPWNIARDKNTSNGEFIVVGVWKGVRLEFLPSVHFNRPYLYTEALTQNQAKLKFECEIIAPPVNELAVGENYTPWEYEFAYEHGLTGIKKDQSVIIAIELTEKSSGKVAFTKEESVSLLNYEKSGIHKKAYEGQFYETEINLSNPKVWYPNGLGEAFLYTVKITMKVDGKEKDLQAFDYGVRTIALSRSAGEKFRKRWGEFQFCINGRDIFLKGMNWMPIDYLYKLERKEYRWALETAKNAGIQLLRVWSGGGIPETDDFYELCDELGLMVWQDSFIANMITPNWDQYLLQCQVEMNLYRIRNHASLAVHCGGNEFAAYATGNAASMYVISREIEDIDPSRPFLRTTPDKGSAHIYRDMEPTWYRNLYQALPFVAESGIHSFPNSKSLRQLISKEEYEKSLSNIFNEKFKETNPELANHFTEFNPERIPRMLARASYINNIDGITLEDLVEATQLSSCEYYQIMIQAMRENYPVTTGIMPWVFRRAWTTVGIQLVDGLGDPIAPYYYVKNAYANITSFVAIEHLTYGPKEKIKLPLCVINDSGKDISDVTAILQVLSPDLKVVQEISQKISLSAQEYKKTVQTVEFEIPSGYKDKFFFIKTALYDGGKLLNQSVYWPKCLSLLSDKETRDTYHTSVQPNLVLKNGPWLKRQISKLKKATLSCNILSTQTNGDRTKIEVELENATDSFVFPLKLDIAQDKTVMYADDNYFMLNPNEKKTVTLEVYCKNPRLMTLDVLVSAWNISKYKLKVRIK